MGTRVTSDEGKTALFDSVTGWAFGPTFDSPEAAASYLKYVQEVYGDPRTLRLETLEQAYGIWTARICDDCGRTDGTHDLEVEH
jgi:hypothetical protein